MNRKKIMILLLTLGIVLPTGLTAPQSKVYADGNTQTVTNKRVKSIVYDINGVAHDTAAIENGTDTPDGINATTQPEQKPLLTSTGYVGNFQTGNSIPSKKSLKDLVAMPNVVTLTPEKNYGLLTRTDSNFDGHIEVDWNFNYKAMNLSNKIYHFVYYAGKECQTDEFVTIKSMKYSDGKIVKVFETSEWMFNKYSYETKIVTYDDTEGYEKYFNNGVITAPSTAPSTAPAELKSNITNTRIAGSDRLATSLSVAKQYIGNGTLDNAVIAYGYNFADALAGATLAKKMNSPIFLVGDLESSQDTLNYISSKLSKNGHIYILGGQSVIPDSFKDWFIGKGYSEDNITRLGGINREGTAEQIANAENAPEGTPVVIANEANFPDALAISPVAAENGYPILIVPNNSLPDYASNYLSTHKSSKVYCVGGTASISDSVMSSIENAAGLSSSSVTRLGGTSRFDTALKVAETFYKGRTSAIVANGYNYPDAISGSVLAAKENSPILLSDGQCDNSIMTYITSMDANKATVTALGGEGAITSSTLDSITHITEPYSTATKDSISAYVAKLPDEQRVELPPDTNGAPFAIE